MERMSQAAVLAGYPWPKRKPRVEATIHGWQPEGLRGESLERTKETKAPSLSEGNGSSRGQTTLIGTLFCVMLYERITGETAQWLEDPGTVRPSKKGM